MTTLWQETLKSFSLISAIKLLKIFFSTFCKVFLLFFTKRVIIRMYLKIGKAYFTVCIIVRRETMYKIGDVFIYGSNGACEITNIKEEKFARETKIYYILSPFFDSRETIFVPVDNTALTAKMKKVLSRSEIMEMIRSIPDCDTIWDENANTRREEYRRIISAADRKELLSLLKTLHDQKQKMEECGKNLSVLDEKYYRKAQNIIHSEIAMVMELEPKEVEPFIEKIINAA